MKKRTFIIAEAGVNHNGSVKIAKELIVAGAAAGADAVKIQSFIPSCVISSYAPKAKYQKDSAGTEETQLEMVKKLCLDESAHRELLLYCRKKKVIFISSPFDLKSIDLLASLKLRIIKIPSGEITNLPYLRKIGSLRKKLILSTGLSDLKEIKKALEILISAGTKKENICVMQCNTAYPAPFKDANLKAMLTIRDTFKVNVGYSDHTLGIEVPIAAVALGASVIEKHFTLDRKMKGPDHKASIEPDELKQMVKMIRNIENALGSGIKAISASEQENKDIVRKSIVAACSIRKGDIFSEDNITVKRPGNGLSPMRWDELLGMTAKKDFNRDELITI